MAKQSIFTRFDSIVKNAGLGRKYALHAYMRYTDLFSKEDREQVESFRKLYNENNNDVTVMESAGYADDQIAVIDRFVAFCQNLPCTKFTGWLRWLFSRRRARKEREYQLQHSADVKVTRDKKLKSFVSEEEFLTNRYFSQQKFFSDKSTECKNRYHSNQKKIMLFSVSVSVISVFSVFAGNVVCSIFHFESSPEWLVNGFSPLVAVISAITAYISSNDKLFQNLDFWVRYRVASEKLKSEYALYQGRCGDYNIPGDRKDANGHSLAEKKFRENVEAIVQEANDNFTRILQNNGDQQPPQVQNDFHPAPQPPKADAAMPPLPKDEEPSAPEPEPEPESDPETPPEIPEMRDESAPSDDEFAEADSLG